MLSSLLDRLKAVFVESSVALITVFFALSSPFVWFFPYTLRYRWITQWSSIVLAIQHFFWNIKVEVEGKENIPEYPCIIIANHQSMWETLYFQRLFPHQTWVLKKELLWIPFFGWGLRLLEPIAIDRKNAFSVRSLTQDLSDRLQKNRWVVIFPEGTRQTKDTPTRFSKSAAFAAFQISAPILLVKHNAGKIWPKGCFIKKPGTISVKIEKPVLPPYESTTALQNYIVDWFKKTPL